MSASAEHEASYRFRNEMMFAPAPLPAAEPGWVTRAPDFVGVGFQRCGTTRWWRLLTDHPAVHRGPVKELHFFDRLQGVEPSDELAAEYAAYFPRPPGLLCGEWTPRYALDHWVPRLLTSAAPEAKLLAIVRDPVERFVSGLALWQAQNRESPDTTAAALARSTYGAQLRHVLRIAGSERILLLQFEACLANPAAELARTYAALGLDPDFVPAQLEQPFNVRKVPAGISDREKRELAEWLEDDVRALATDFPQLDLSVWPNFAHLA